MDRIWYTYGPLGKILLASSDGKRLSGLWFSQQKYAAAALDPAAREEFLPIFAEAEKWLEQYYHGRDPGPVPALEPKGTPFQLRVWSVMARIPYGETCSYGELASAVSAQADGARVSPRAIGSAVGHNPISVMLPCHRVLGADGSLHGYAGGIWRKAALLAMEQGVPFAASGV